MAKKIIYYFNYFKDRYSKITPPLWGYFFKHFINLLIRPNGRIFFNN